MTEIRNPAQLPTDLNPAEKKFARCLAEGKPCVVGNGDFFTPRPERGIQSGDNANMVRSEVIRFFAYGGNEDNPVLGSEIYLQGAWIVGGLSMTHASIPYALDFRNCHFAASVVMLYMECAALYLQGSCLANGLNADGLTTKGSVNLRESFSAGGEVRLLGANIGGDLDCANGKFHNLGEYALSADNLTTKGSVNLRNGFSAEGEVSLLGANIGGELDCENGKFNNENKRAFSADKLTTKGSVNLREGFSAKGEVRLLGANVGGNLDCENGRFNNANGDAFSADRLTTKGSVHLRGGFSAEGKVRFAGANIGGNVDCAGGQFNNPNGYALAIEGSNININLFWRNTTCKGDVNLAYARADVLSDDPNSWESCKVVLDGFTYNRFFNPMDASFRLRWLDNRPDEVGFSPLPYEQAAKVLFGMGHTHDARKILLEKEHIRMQQEKESSEIFSPVSHDAAANILFTMGENREAREILLERERLLTERGEFPRIWRWGRKIWDALAGYGYRPWLHTFVISLVIIVFGSALFCWGEHAGRIVPYQPAALVSGKYQYGRIPAETPDETVARKFSGYPEFNPILFSVDIFVPLLNLHQEPFWYPAPDGGRQHWWGSAEDGEFSWWFLLEWWYWFQIMAGGVLTSFFLLSIARLLRPRQSSGERD